LAAKKSTSTIGAKSSTSTGSLSKLMGCLKLISGPLTRAQLDQCYNIVYSSCRFYTSSSHPFRSRVSILFYCSPLAVSKITNLTKGKFVRSSTTTGSLSTIFC
jgi:hypothetical protein